MLDAPWLVDSFDVFDDGSYIGSTSFPTCTDTSCTEYCSTDPNICINDPDASKGVFYLEPGPHAITIIPTETSYSVGTGYLRVDAIFIDSDEDGVLDGDDICPDSDLRATVIQQQCDSGVTNTLFEDGCTISDNLARCLNDASNHCSYVSCVADMVNEWNISGVLDGGETGEIISCAARMN